MQRTAELAMMTCEVREGLRLQKDAAFNERYEAKSALELVMAQKNTAELDSARTAAQEAEREVHHLQRAIIDHYAKHHCNED